MKQLMASVLHLFIAAVIVKLEQTQFLYNVDCLYLRTKFGLFLEKRKRHLSIGHVEKPAKVGEGLTDGELHEQTEGKNCKHS